MKKKKKKKKKKNGGRDIGLVVVICPVQSDL